MEKGKIVEGGAYQTLSKNSNSKFNQLKHQIFDNN
jgi:hypothetical protein